MTERWQHRGIAVVAGALLLAAPPVAAQGHAKRVAPGGIPVRFPEGTAHGFLDLRSAAGADLAAGDLLQSTHGATVESRLVFHFADASVFDETVTFTQQRVFEMQTYHLVQHGPAFATDIDATLWRSGRYDVKARAHAGGERKEYQGTIELPPDISNGLVITIAKNLAPGDTETVHLVAFLPKPRLIELAFVPSGTQLVRVGQHQETAVRFVLKPKLGMLTAIVAKILGKMPPDSYAWIVTDDVPAFVRFEGPMYSGPVWRLDLTSPAWSHQVDGQPAGRAEADGVDH